MKKITKALLYVTTGVGVVKLRTKDRRIIGLLANDFDIDLDVYLKKYKHLVYTINVLVWPTIIVDNLFEFIADDIFKLDIWNIKD